ncbi:MAG TPA: hypothetical protein VK796_07875 [Cytophaga sp.]|jgi:hypothetical protein|nr:hypothetical protein [Cytophaga sp.]
MKAFYLLLIVAIFGATSCRTKDGAPGPAGESSLNKQGSMNGTLTYYDHNGAQVVKNFDYNYYETVTDNQFYYYKNNSGEYDITLKRRDLKDKNSYFSFDIQGYGGADEITPAAPFNGNMEFSLVTVINNSVFDFNTSFYVGDASSTFDVTNFSLDTLTGRMIFDYTSTVSYNDMDGDTYNTNDATLNGHVDIILSRRYDSYNLSRKGTFSK